MKNISWYWNLLHFYLFIWFKHAHSIFNQLNPITYFFKIPIVKNFYAKRGISDMNKFADEVVFNDREKGIIIIWAGVQIGGIFIFIEYAIFNIVQGCIGKSLINQIWENKVYASLFVIMLLSAAGLFNYFVVFRNDMYLKYFNEFEKLPKKSKRNYGWLSFLAIILILVFLVFSFVLVPSGARLP